jgi:hypothetical protein
MVDIKSDGDFCLPKRYHHKQNLYSGKHKKHQTEHRKYLQQHQEANITQSTSPPNEQTSNMNAALRSSMGTPLRQSTSLLRTQLLTKPVQRTLSTTTTTTPPHVMPTISNISTPLRSKYNRTERRVIGIATFAAANACIGAGLYFYVRNEVDAIEEAF